MLTGKCQSVFGKNKFNKPVTFDRCEGDELRAVMSDEALLMIDVLNALCVQFRQSIFKRIKIITGYFLTHKKTVHVMHSLLFTLLIINTFIQFIPDVYIVFR